MVNLSTRRWSTLAFVNRELRLSTVDEDRDPLPYTAAGKLIVIATISTPIVGVSGMIYVLSRYSPDGRYPLVFFCIPFVVPTFVLFYGGCALLRRWGIRVRKDDVISADGGIEPARTSSTPIAKTKHSAYCTACRLSFEFEHDGRCPKCGWPV